MILFERDSELALIGEALEGGELAVVEGPAGIGKSSLLTAAAAAATRVGFAVAEARGTPLETMYPFGMARQLFEPLLLSEDRERLLSGAAAAAALAVDPESPSENADAGEFAVLRGLTALATNASQQLRTVLLVDDAQWADAPSLRFLAFLARRLEGRSVGLVVVIRTGEQATGATLLDELRALAGQRLIRPQPLSSDAVAQLVRARSPEATDQQCGICHRASAGNPLLAGEMARALADGEDPVRAASAGLSMRVRRRVVEADQDGPGVAGAVAVLGERATLTRVARLAGTSSDLAAGAVAALRRAEILEEDDALRFVHPLVQIAVLESLDDVERIALHRAAAEALAAESAPAEQVAAHLLEVPGAESADVLAHLRAAAAAALGRGAARPAVGLLRRALSEPPPVQERCRLLRELAHAERLTGDEAAISNLQAALAISAEGEERATTARELAMAQYDLSRYADAAATLTHALRDAPVTLEPLVRDALRVDLLTVALQVSSVDADSLRTDLSRGPAPTDPAVGTVYRIASIALSMADARVEESAPELERLLRATPPRRDRLDLNAPLWYALTLIERFEAAGELIDEAEADGEDWPRRRFAINLARAGLRYRLGDLTGAGAIHEANLETVADDRTGGLFARAGLASVCVDRGDVKRALTLVREDDIPRSASESHLCWLHWSLGRARSAAGDNEGAARAFDAGCRIGRTFPGDQALVWEEGAADRIACYRRVGRENEAQQATAEILALARRIGLRGLEAIGLRSLGMLNADASALERSVELLAAGPMQLELARSQYELGAAWRRAGRRADSRAPLRLALDGAYACGARPLAERAREELVLAGARPRRDAVTGRDALTAAERRVARRAASGASNREIADELFVTVKTIEGHLANAFRKLDVHRRTELVKALDAEAP